MHANGPDVCMLQSVDMLLWQWDSAYKSLLASEARYEAGGCSKRPTHRLKCCGGESDYKQTDSPRSPRPVVVLHMQLA
jgi:hypothetical protein